MMTNKQLNDLVFIYQKTRSDDVFTTIYHEVMTHWDGKIKTGAKSIRSDEHDLMEVYEKTLLVCVMKYNATLEKDFIDFYISCATKARTDLYRKCKRRLREWLESEMSFAESFDDVDETPLEMAINEIAVSENNSAATEYFRTKKADQRQLIDFLVGRQSDKLTTDIVNVGLRYKNVKTVGRPITLHWFIANELGIDRRTVVSKLRNLAKNFDPQQFGDYRDYLFAR